MRSCFAQRGSTNANIPHSFPKSFAFAGANETFAFELPEYIPQHMGSATLVRCAGVVVMDGSEDALVPVAHNALHRNTFMLEEGEDAVVAGAEFVAFQKNPTYGLHSLCIESEIPGISSAVDL